MRLSSMWLTATGLLASVVLAGASVGITPPPKVADGKPDRLIVYPTSITLDSRRAYRQFVVTGFFKGEARDLTDSATYRLADGGRVAKVIGGRVVPSADGRSSITISYGGWSVPVPVAVSNVAKPDPIQFKFETLPILTKQGCANGSCHGSPHGKGGFSLSLFGYDPQIDRISLTRDGFNRRVNVQEPSESLMLKKPLLELPHGGGKRLRKNYTPLQILNRWIAEGANAELPATECTRIVVYPDAARVLHAPYLKQQLSVVAYFSDGSSRDVTSIATYETSNPSVATVDPEGKITGHVRGQAGISVRYLDKFQSLYMTVVQDVPGFTWNAPPENNLVDRLVDDKLKQLQYQPSGICTDPVFLRRVYLDLTGLLPTVEKARAFLKDASPQKRSRLIDELLASEEYARFWALKKADLMRVSPSRLKDGRADRFAAWITDSFRRDEPYDQFAREVLTSSGDTSNVAPANYFLAVPTLEERTEMTAQIFMGTRVECTKCHNHPFENWTMRDYYSIAAVFARLQTNDVGDVMLAKTGEATHPTTHAVMQPWGSAPGAGTATTDRRVAFAGWLTKPGNPFFARVEVNRIWADLTGRGIVDPVDDFRSSNPPANVPLLDALAKEFEKSGYSRKHILRLICNSYTYQRTTATTRFNEGEETLFSHARSRLLTAEQLKDAISLTSHVLDSPTGQATRLTDLRRQVRERTVVLETAYSSWIVEKTKMVATLPFWKGGWYVAGPFAAGKTKAGEAPVVLVSESQPVDLSARLTGGLHWTLRPDLRDGATGVLTGERRGSTSYLYRRIYSAQPHKFTAEIATTDTAQIWLNGTLLTEKPQKGESKIPLTLRTGINDLLIKVVGRTPRAGFTFQLTGDALPKAESDIPSYLVDLLMIAEERRTPEQQQQLHALYIEQDPVVKDATEQISRMETRMDYATQRPYPESSAFTVTFGQPKRETACTCERQTSPTLLQALELLNGKPAYEMAQKGAVHYATLPDARLVEELYLAGMCRYPTEREQATAHQYLARATNRTDAVTDLIWTLTNTREFLFQH